MLLAPILEVLIDVSARRVTLVMESHVAVRLIIFYLQSNTGKVNIKQNDITNHGRSDKNEANDQINK